MPVIHSSSLKSPFWLPNGHLQSIYPSLFRKVTIPYQQQRINTPDDDFLDLFWTKSVQNQRLVILTHGLEGDSSRQYMTGMVRLLTANGYDCLAWNYRGCGIELNKQLRFYHSGETSDLHLVIEQALQKGYTDISLMGFSLGGNVTLKYLGERGANISKFIKKAVVFSVPMDLEACSRNIVKPQNWIYNLRFLKTLKQKLRKKAVMYPQAIDLTASETLKTLWDFDDCYTSKLHGFDNALDYYSRCSSKRFVEGITIPTLIVNAKNDPLVPYESLSISVIEKLKNVALELTNEGGHCGFRPHRVAADGAYWSEKRAIDFLNQ